MHCCRLLPVRIGFTILTRNETRLAILALLWYIMERVVSTGQRERGKGAGLLG